MIRPPLKCSTLFNRLLEVGFNHTSDVLDDKNLMNVVDELLNEI